MELTEDEYAQGAVGWALARVGSADYALRCYAFVEDAYELGNDIELDGLGTSAKEAADAYEARDDGRTPPVGAYVCYDCGGLVDGEWHDWGHIGLSVGDGRVIHTWPQLRVDDYRAMEALSASGWTSPRYIGWVSPSRILRGMQLKQCYTRYGDVR